MFSNKTKKYLISILIFGQLVFLPGMAFALGLPIGAVFPISTNDTGSLAANTAFYAVFNPIVATNTGCAQSEQANAAADAAATAAYSGLALISGSDAVVGRLGIDLNNYNGFAVCRQGVVTALKLLPAPNSFTSQQETSLAQQANAGLQADLAKIAQINARLTNAEQGFWKTLVFNILIQTTKAVADALVTKLVNNYKIVDFKSYADSVATLVYDNQFIRDEYPNSYDQLMARAILEQPEFRNQVPPAMFVAADNALGFNPTTLNPNSPNFYSQMASVGSTAANPYYQHTVMVAGVDQAHANALASANLQVAQSAGYKTPMNCQGSLAQQQQITLQTKAANDQLANRQQLLTSLQQAQQLGQNVNQSDLAKAQADYNSALAQWNSIPDAYSVTSPAIVMCEAIASPVNLINKGIDQAFNAIGVNMSQYNNNNLPAFITLIGQVASQIGTSLIFGGTSAAQSTAIINENKVATGLAASVNQSLSSNAASTAASAVTFVAIPAPGAGANNYQLNWFVDNTVISGADHITLLGNGIQSTSKTYPLSGSTSVVTTTGGNYTMTVYDANNNVLAGSSTTIAPTYAGGGSAGAQQATITIAPSVGTVSAGSNLTISCSNLSGLPSGAQVVVNVNKNSIPQTIPINNGQCSATVAVVNANGFVAGTNSVNAWVADSGGTQINNTPDVTSSLNVTGTVLAAYTDQPNLETRGPSVQFNPRGN